VPEPTLRQLVVFSREVAEQPATIAGEAA